MNTLPLVSCVMPVGYGDKYFQVALECFLSQNYKGELEIILVDNSRESIESLLPKTAVSKDICKFVYQRCEPMSVGALRNLGNSFATGEVIVNCDEDDWSHPNRLTAQVERLQESGKAVTGWHNVLFYDASTDRCYKYRYSSTPPYACGTSHCYLREWWQQHSYPGTGIEDYLFQKQASDSRQLDSVDAQQLCVVRAHKDSKCPPQLGSHQFPAVERSMLPTEFFTAIQ
jgi:glycosyltransferase involved in cell wall biosynthesis